MRWMIVVAGLAVSGPALADGVVTRDTPAKSAASTAASFAHDATIANLCGLRTDAWQQSTTLMFGVGMLAMANRSPKDFIESGNKTAAAAYVTALMSQAIRDAIQDHARGGAAMCAAFEKSGALAVVELALRALRE